MSIDPLDPDDKLDYTWNWDKWLPVGETITASAFTVPNGITKDSESFASRTTTIWLKNGTPGIHNVTNQITTSPGGRIRSKTIPIRVKEL
jgi:kynurenine formamidase